MSKVKYIRVSTQFQNTERQKNNESNFSKLYIDYCSGCVKLSDRKEGKKLIKDIQNGCISEIHIESIDRLGRNITDILENISFFEKKSINLFVENIGMYSMVKNSVNPTFKMIVSILASVAEMEIETIKERQRQGIEIAKLKGVYKGRLYGSKMSNEEFLEKYKSVVKELKKGETLRRIAKLCDCSLATVQKVQKVINENKQ